MITQLGVGEALVSFLDHKGIPSMVERALILPPMGQTGRAITRNISNTIGRQLVRGILGSIFGGRR